MHPDPDRPEESRGDPMEASAAPQVLQACEDFYFEDGYLVFTEAFHLKRGSCCGSGCRHCPYGNAG